MSTGVRPQGCTNFKLRQLTRRVSQLYDEQMSKAGLKITQYSLLSRILSLGPMRPGELAQAMAIDASTLTRNLKVLADAGWVTITAGADERSRTVTITEAGRNKRMEGRQYWKAAQISINQLLGEQRVVALHALLDEALALVSAGPTAAEE